MYFVYTCTCTRMSQINFRTYNVHVHVKGVYLKMYTGLHVYDIHAYVYYMYVEH